MKKVLIPTKLDKVARELLTSSGQYTVVQAEKTELLILAQQHPDAHALIVRSEKVTPDILDALPNLKAIVRAGSGFNTIDVKYARQKKVDVLTTPGANSNAVAEEVVALMLADARHLVEADPSCRRGRKSGIVLSHETRAKMACPLGRARCERSTEPVHLAAQPFRHEANA